MQKSPPKAPEPAIGVQDIPYILNKHKWMILILTALGLVSAAAVRMKQIPFYQSEAKLLVRYVVESGSVDSFNRMKSPGAANRSGDPVIITEMEILKSADLAVEVAGAIGAEKLIPVNQNSVSLEDAARVVSSNLTIDPVRGGNVLRVLYKNEDPEMARKVLSEIIERYFKKHLEIHRSAAAFDIVSKQAEEVKIRLENTEKELGLMRTKAGIVSLNDAMNTLSEQRNKISSDLLQARAMYAEYSANVRFLEKQMENQGIQDDANASDTRNRPAPEATAEEAQAVDVPPSEIVREYRALLELLTFLQKRDMELSIKYKPGNRLQAQNKQQMYSSDARRKELLERYPSLAQQAVAETSDPNNPARILRQAESKLAATAARINALEENLKEITGQFSQQVAIGAAIDALERRRQMEEAEYRNLELNLKKARVDQTLDPTRMPNIKIVQDPSKPLKVIDDSSKKLILGLAAGGLALGLGIAFLLELLLNGKVERPADIRSRLQMPLMLTIPRIRQSGRNGNLLMDIQTVHRIGDSKNNMQDRDRSDALAIRSPQNKSSHFIMPFCDTIRDRIIYNFLVNNITHKPKLIAVTGISEGAGSSTIAAGLAKSFSEMKDSKILLVDFSSVRDMASMRDLDVAKHSLPNALRIAGDVNFRNSKQKLYYANASVGEVGNGNIQLSSLDLHGLMPLLNASEYDYIIFDLPTITQTSPTITMAGFMDKVLLVLDADNTSREKLKWSYSELINGRADVSCIFNKCRSIAE